MSKKSAPSPSCWISAQTAFAQIEILSGYASPRKPQFDLEIERRRLGQDLLDTLLGNLKGLGSGKQIGMESRKVLLRGEFVELNKVLKFENLVASGGEAKQAVAAGHVRVDGQIETRVRRKLFAGSEVDFAGVRLQIVAADGLGRLS